MARPPTYVTVLLGLAAAGASTYAWHLQGELREARARPPERLAPAAPPAPAPEANAPVAEETETASRAERRGARAAERAAASAGAEGPAAGERRFGPARITPEMRQLAAMQQRSMLDGRYAALFRKLNLSPADVERLKTLLVERQSAPSEVYAVAQEQGLDAQENRRQIRDLIKGLETESDTAIRELLGEANYQQYQQYERTAPQRNLVSQLEQRLSYSPTPFYGNQAEQLVALLAAAAPQNRPGNPAAFGFAASGGNVISLGGRNQITDAVIAQSAGFLSAAQVQALRDYQQEQQAQAELLQEMRQSRRGATVAVPGSTGP